MKLNDVAMIYFLSWNWYWKLVKTTFIYW